MNAKFLATSLFAIVVGLAAAAQAALVSVDGTFLSFTSSMLTDRISLVNNIPLTATASSITTPTGPQYLSNTVNFGAPTSALTFTYDPNMVLGNGQHPLANSFTFTGASGVQVNVGDTFQVGTFTFTNGQWFYQTDIGFRLTSHSTDAALDGHIFAGTLRLISVASTPKFIDVDEDARAEADFFYVRERPDLGSARVFDVFLQPTGNPGNVGEFAFNGKIGSLIPTSLVALNSAGFTHPSVEAAIPEPHACTLLLAGLGLLRLAGRRRRGLSVGAAGN